MVSWTFSRMNILTDLFVLLLLPATFKNVNCQGHGGHGGQVPQPPTPVPEMTHQGGMHSSTNTTNNGSLHQAVVNSSIEPSTKGPMKHEVMPMDTGAPSSGGHGGHNAPPPQAPSNNDETMTSDGSGAHSNHGAAGTAAGGHYGFFHLTTNAILLFEQWQTNTWQEILGAGFAFGIAAIFYEGLKGLRQSLHERSRKTTGFITMEPPLRRKIFNCMHVLQSFLHMVQLVYSYFLMLAFMTFNVWICIGIALGAGIGYFLFGFDRHKIEDANEHCT